MEFKAGIFDLDGVIVDTARYHYLAWRRLGREWGFEFSVEQNELLKGVSRKESLEILLHIGGITNLSETEKEEAAERKNAWYVDYISRITSSDVLPGVLGFLNELKETRTKIVLGSASKNAKLILRRLQISSLFDVIIDGTRVAQAKPDPEIFLLGAQELGVSPSECVVFEDAIAGIEAAKRAGMYCVGIGDTETLQSADMVLPGFRGVSWVKMQKQVIHR